VGGHGFHDVSITSTCARRFGGLVMSLPKSPSQPVRLREPLCKFFSGCPEVKAAWLFSEENPAKPFEQVYVVGLMVAGNDAEEMKREAVLAF
jgi:hypothetical protein